MTQAIKQVATEVTKAAVSVIIEVANPAQHRTRRNATVSGPKAGRPQLRQTFDWSAQNMFDELKLKMEVGNIFMTKIMIQKMKKKLAIIKNWIGREGLHFIETLTIDEQEITIHSIIMIL